MKLVLVSSDPSSGELRLISGRSYEGRDEAFTELRRALASGEVDSSRDLYLLDLDASSPVVIMAAPVEAAPPVAEPVEETFAAAVVEQSAQDTRVAEQPPTAVEAAAAGPEEPWPEELPTPPSAEAVVDVPEGTEVAIAPSPEAAMVADEEPTLTSLPAEVADAGPAPSLETAAGPGIATLPEDPMLAALTSALETDPTATEEPAAAEEPVIPAPTLQWPWEAAVQDESVASAVEPAAPDIAMEPEAAEPSGVMEPAGAMGMSGSAGAAEGVEGPADSGEHGYEPGALNMNEYTCDDCVYANTCPNKDQKAPAACGSFQWRSV